MSVSLVCHFPKIFSFQSWQISIEASFLTNSFGRQNDQLFEIRETQILIKRLCGMVGQNITFKNSDNNIGRDYTCVSSGLRKKTTTAIVGTCFYAPNLRYKMPNGSGRDMAIKGLTNLKVSDIRPMNI